MHCTFIIQLDNWNIHATHAHGGKARYSSVSVHVCDRWPYNVNVSHVDVWAKCVLYCERAHLTLIWIDLSNVWQLNIVLSYTPVHIECAHTLACMALKQRVCQPCARARSLMNLSKVATEEQKDIFPSRSNSTCVPFGWAFSVVCFPSRSRCRASTAFECCSLSAPIIDGHIRSHLFYISHSVQ